jgi:AhpD family alkylhydroperoxidase
MRPTQGASHEHACKAVDGNPERKRCRATRELCRAVASLLRKFIELLAAAGDSSIKEPIRDIVAVRAAQMNNCTFCLDLCARQAKIHGEYELRLHHLAAWQDSALFGPRERVALASIEVLTKLPEEGVANEIYDPSGSELFQEGKARI